MISLKKALNEYEELNRHLHSALDCYRAAIGNMERHAVAVSPEEVVAHRKALRLIRLTLEGSATKESLAGSKTALESELEGYSKRATSSLKSREGEMRAILEILAQAAQAMTAHSDSYSGRFRTLAQELESVVQLEDLGAIRRRLATSVNELRSCVESMQREEQASVARLRGELRTFQRRLEEAESLAATDTLTGLANRRHAESLMRSKIEAGQCFSIMLFDLDDFKLVNDEHGHHVGDCLLQAFAKRLLGHFRAGDVVCRWGGDEFLVVLSTGLADAGGRGRDVADRMGGLYAVKSNKGAVNIQVSATVGCATYQSGESAEELFAKADAALYQRKGQRNSLMQELEQSCVPSRPKA